MMTQILRFLPAVFCLVYGAMVFAVGSGTGFYLVWLALGAVFFAAALAAQAGLWRLLPMPVRAIFLVLILAAAGVFLFTEAKIISRFGAVPEEDADYLLVLGAQVRPSGPSVVLRYRLDAAAGYLRTHPQTRCIVSGGQGANEPFTEAEGMKNYLTAAGIDGSRILTEDRSASTKENMTFSMKLFDPEKDRIAIVTNNFHIFRAERLAKKAGIAHVSALSAPSDPVYLPNNLLREFLGVVKDYLAGNL